MIRLLQGDCLEILPTLAENSIDAVVTDPPYHLTTNKKGGSGDASINLKSPDGRSRVSTGFMSKEWDGGDIAMRPETWSEVLRVLKPGGHMLCFGGTRTFHRMAVAIEDAGFEIRDTMMWMFSTGFPKGYNIHKGFGDRICHCETITEQTPECEMHPLQYPDVSETLDISQGGGEILQYSVSESRLSAVGQQQPVKQSKIESGTVAGQSKSQNGGAWPVCAECGKPRIPKGFNSALKPAYEPIILARKPLDGSIANNFLKYGTGGLNIDACRVPINPEIDDPRLGGNGEWQTDKMAKNAYGKFAGTNSGSSELGRFPSNILLDDSPEVRNAFPVAPGASAPVRGTEDSTGDNGIFGHYNRVASMSVRQDIDKSAARFFYCAKSSQRERQGSLHPTIKPVSLMRYLCKLITPPDGMILDPFAGSGTTGQAAVEEGFNVTLIEREAEYIQDIRNRLAMYLDDSP